MGLGASWPSVPTAAQPPPTEARQRRGPSLPTAAQPPPAEAPAVRYAVDRKRAFRGRNSDAAVCACGTGGGCGRCRGGGDRLPGAGSGWRVDAARERGGESVPDRRELLQAARGADVGLDERGGHRQGWQVHLGGRALRRELVLGRGQGRDVAARHGAQVRRLRQAGAEHRQGHDDLPPWHPRGSRWQRLGDRRPGQPASASPRGSGRRAAAAGCRRR